MRRPGPLRDLPLEPFLLPNSNIPDNLKSFNCPRPNKRPHSPAAPSLFSPAKRRILNEEGILYPEKAPRSIASSRTRLAASSFSDFFGDSPAKKLDFGPPKGHQQPPPSIPDCAAESRSRSPSCSRLSSSDISVHTNAIHQPSTSSITLDNEGPSSTTTTAPRRSSRLRGAPPSVAPIPIPRDMPPPPDRQSVHYPGFDTFQDTHIQYVPVQTNSIASDALEVGRCAEGMKIDKEGYKENVAPKKRAKKGSTVPTSHDLMKIALLAPEAKEFESINMMRSSTTSKKSVVTGRELASRLTPRRPTLCTSTLQLSLSPSRATPDERRERRRLLEDEVNNITDEDDDEDNSTMMP